MCWNPSNLRPRRPRSTSSLAAVGLAVLFALGACNSGWLSVDGEADHSARPGVSSPSGSSGPGAPETDAGTDFKQRTQIGVGGLKRLTSVEYDNTLHELLGTPFGTERRYGEKYMPTPAPEPFSNNFLRQKPSLNMVEQLEQSAGKIAEKAARKLEGSESMQKYVLGCVPEGPEDRACYRTFLESFGERALGRPLESSERAAYMREFFELESLRSSDEDAVAQAARDASFFLKVELTLRALLQHSEFLYRPEIGESEATSEGGDVQKLDDRSMALRLSYFLWGGPPDRELLEAAQRGELSTETQVRRQAERMIDDPRTKRRIYQFHAAWMGFQDFWLKRIVWDIPEDVAASIRKETRKLLDRVIFEEKTDWRTIFLADKTYVDRRLARWYGFVEPDDVDADGSWVRYPEGSKRGGILSHASFLTNGRGQGGKTKIIRRAALIFDRLTCNGIQPAANMDPPQEAEEPRTDCKFDWFEAKTLAGTCKTCHYRLNHVGVGLENFDNYGRYREKEPDTEDECTIPSDKGAFYENKGGDEGWSPSHEFRGPGELGRILVDEKNVARCMVEHLYEFALGHAKQHRDEAAIEHLYESFRASNYRFDKLLVTLASSRAFRYKVDRKVQSTQ